MELWIRSQDKTRLSIITNIQLVECGGEYSLVGYTNDYMDDFDLGTYKTKERALEVLDEIQRIVNGNDIVERLGNKGNMLNVFPNLFYQMPEE